MRAGRNIITNRINIGTSFKKHLRNRCGTDLIRRNMERSITLLISHSQIHAAVKQGGHQRHILVLDRLKHGFTRKHAFVSNRVRKGEDA